MAISQETVDAVVKRSRYHCEICDIPLYFSKPELHHVLIHRAKKHPEYDHEINLQLVCPTCHSEKANTRQNEVNHYQRVCAHYGKSVVEDWINSLGLKSREYWG